MEISSQVRSPTAIRVSLAFATPHLYPALRRPSGAAWEQRMRLVSIIAGAANPYYAPAPVYAPPPGACWFEPEDVWNGYRWVRRRVRVCE